MEIDVGNSHSAQFQLLLLLCSALSLSFMHRLHATCEHVFFNESDVVNFDFIPDDKYLKKASVFW